MILIFKKKKESSGFSLIELLVILVIVGAGISLTGPSLFRTYDKIRANAEEQRLFDIMNSVKNKSFIRQISYTIKFEGRFLIIKKNKIDFKYISFPEEVSITFNGNGFSDSKELKYQIQGIQKTYDIS